MYDVMGMYGVTGTSHQTGTFQSGHTSDTPPPCIHTVCLHGAGGHVSFQLVPRWILLQSGFFRIDRLGVCFVLCVVLCVNVAGVCVAGVCVCCWCVCMLLVCMCCANE